MKATAASKPPLCPACPRLKASFTSKGGLRADASAAWVGASTLGNGYASGNVE
jgi:hypothetical protein